MVMQTFLTIIVGRSYNDEADLKDHVISVRGVIFSMITQQRHTKKTTESFEEDNYKNLRRRGRVVQFTFTG